VKIRRFHFPKIRNVFWLLSFIVCGALSNSAAAQAVPYARSFPKSKEEVDKALNELQAYAGQKLPIADGFVAAGDQPLDRYERAFYQLSIDLLPGTTSNDTIVRVSAKIIAWYADRDPSKSGYQVLPSNGRLELDLLDRLTEKFGGKSGASIAKPDTLKPPIPRIDISAGSPAVPLAPRGFPAPSAEAPPTSGGTAVTALAAERGAEEKRVQQLNTELQNLQDIQRNQAHPLNLVVVKKSGTSVLARPAEGSRLLFSAAADDEFEFIDAEGEWIHVQISGASRGYIRRNGLDLPEGISARLESQNGNAGEEKPAAFQIEREENNMVPGDWEPLKGKAVKIYTVQPASQDPRETRASAKLSFAASLFKKFASESAAASPSPRLEGAVVIFDSADGGVIGCSLPNAQELAGGSLTQEIFWKRCYMDPPDAFQSSNPQASPPRQK
jgi:hypothetical protein